MTAEALRIVPLLEYVRGGPPDVTRFGNQASRQGLQAGPPSVDEELSPTQRRRGIRG